MGNQLFTLKDLLSNQLVGGLYENFVLMDQAHIVTDIQVEASIPVQFNLSVDTDTTVVLTSDTFIPITWVKLNAYGTGINLSIDTPAEITLPADTPLDIHLKIDGLVDTSIPTRIPVHVDIPLNQTDLHEPFVGLRGVVSPYDNLLSKTPNSWEETPCATLCRIGSVPG